METDTARKAPDRAEARERYKRLVKTYELWRRPTEKLRQDAVSELQLQPGQTVLDIGCGTGFSFEALESRLDGQGRLIGVDYSGDMLDRGREWVSRNGWNNVTLLESAIEDFELEEPADAALLFFTHDILQTPLAIKNVIKQLKPGGKIAVGGMKFAQGDNLLRNRFVRMVASPYVTTFDSYDRPWLGLASAVPGLEVQQRWGGCSYLARGTVA